MNTITDMTTITTMTTITGVTMLTAMTTLMTTTTSMTRDQRIKKRSETAGRRGGPSSPFRLPHGTHM